MVVITTMSSFFSIATCIFKKYLEIPQVVHLPVQIFWTHILQMLYLSAENSIIYKPIRKRVNMIRTLLK